MTATAQSYANHRRVFPLYHLFALPILLAHVVVTMVVAVRHPTLWNLWLVVVALGLVGGMVANRASTLIVQNRVIGLEMRLRLATVAAGRALPAHPRAPSQAARRTSLRRRRRARRPRGAMPARRARDGRRGEARGAPLAPRLRARLIARLHPRILFARERASPQRLGLGRGRPPRAGRLLLRRARSGSSPRRSTRAATTPAAPSGSSPSRTSR